MNTYQIPLQKDRLPISADGRLTFKVEPEVFALLRNGQAFSSDVARGADSVLQVQFDLDGEETLTIGEAAGLGLSVEAGTKARLDLAWPNEEVTELDTLGLEVGSDQVYLVLHVEGQASVDGETENLTPQHPLSVTLGLKAGGEVAYTLAAPYPSGKPSNEILRDFVSKIRLPQSVRTPEDLPEKGEVIDLEYGGYLDLGLEAGWGYDVKKYREIQYGNLSLESRLDVSSEASLSISGGIAGEYAFEVRRDAKRPTWARIEVKKRSERSRKAALDVQVGATITTEGLPDEASTFAASLLGVTIPDQAAELRTLLGDPDALLARLEEEVGALTQRAAEDLFEQWYPDERIEQKAGPFLEDLEGVLERYEELAGEEGSWTDALSAYTVDELSVFLNALRELEDRSELAGELEPAVLKILRRIAGEKYSRMLASDTAFSEQKKLIEEQLAALLEGGHSRVLDLFGLSDELLNVDALLETLRGYDSPEELAEKAEAHVLELASRLTDRAFEDLVEETGVGDELEDAFRELDETLTRVEDLTATAYEKFESALNDRYRVDLARTYARTRSNEALVDLRIDLSQEKGRELIQDVLHGNLVAVSRRSSADYVEVIGGTFIEKTKSTSRLEVSLLGWEYSHLHELTITAEKSIQEQGTLHVYDLGAREREVEQTRREEVAFEFMAHLVGSGRAGGPEHQDVIETVDKLAISYGLLVEDRDLTEAELTQYLALADYLGMLPGEGTPKDYVSTLRAALQHVPASSWGRVTLEYRVQYEPGMLLDLLMSFDGHRERSILRNVYRNIAAKNFRLGSRSSGSVFGNSSLRMEVARCLENYDRDALPGHVSEAAENILRPIYAYEDRLVDIFSTLHGLVTSDQASPDRLEDAFKGLIELRSKLARYMEPRRKRRQFVNPFFAILDRMQALQFPERTDRRDSYAELRIEQNEKKLDRILVET